MFSVIHKGVCLLCVCWYHWVSYRRNCKGGEWWWKSYCSLFCNFHRKLITYLCDTRCPIILTPESNINKILVSSVCHNQEHPVGIKAVKAKLEKEFCILVLKIFLFTFVHIVVSVEQQKLDPMNLSFQTTSFTQCGDRSIWV